MVINGKSSGLKCIMAGVPQGSVLGPLLFLVYINDFIEGISSDGFLFADDTSLFKIVKRNQMVKAVAEINSDLSKLEEWCNQWLVCANPTKTVFMLFSSKSVPSAVPPIYFGTSELKQVPNHKHLGLTLTPALSWSKHIADIIIKANRRLGVLKRHKYSFSRHSLEIGYITFVRPLIEYGNIIYDACSKEDAQKLEDVQLEAARIVTGCKSHTSHRELYHELGWQTLSQRRDVHKLVKLYCIIKYESPKYLSNIVHELRFQHNHDTRAASTNQICLPKCKKEVYKKSYFPSTCKAWNNLKPDIKNAQNKNSFQHLLYISYNTCERIFCHDIPRQTQVAFSQLRVGFSNLNNDLYVRNCIDKPDCDCGHPKENAKHFLLCCPNFIPQRTQLLDNVRKITKALSITTNTLLYGHKNINLEDNITILKHTCNFISETKRILFYK